MKCLACRRDNPADASFCNGCGQPFDVAPQIAAQEWRPLTVLFCDIVDSVALASRLDPEDWRSVVVRYNTACKRAIVAGGGFIVQYLGDGVLAYFGYPAAGEDDAARAVQSGLGMLRRVSVLADAVRAEHGIDLAIRVGIHSGLVIVGDTGDGLRPETQAVGDALNVAARVQGSAEPDTVVISAETLTLVEGLFVTSALGPHQLRGLPRPIELFRVDGVERVSHRLDAQSVRGLSTFVGRAAELDRLVEAWLSADGGTLESVVVVGEPGVGKSRLIKQARDRITDLGATWLQGRCTAADQNSPFSAWIDLVRRATGIDAATSSEDAVAAIVSACDGLGLDDSAGGLLAKLVGVVGDETASALAASKRRESIDVLMRWLRALAADRTLVVAIEDVHWADPSTKEVLATARGALAGARIALVVTSRLDDDAEAAGEVIRLHGLTDDESRQLATAVAGDRLSPELIDAVVRRGSGLPLFLEEILRSTTGAEPDVSVIPPTLRVSLAARLDRLGPARDVAQTAATIGGEVPIELIGRVINRPPSEVHDLADEIVRNGIATWVSPSTTQAIEFTHALIADAAYDSLLRARRKELHGVIAAELDRSGNGREQPERVARHYELAGMDLLAFANWLAALKRALGQHALDEGESHLQHALGCLARLGDQVDAATEMAFRLSQLEFLSVRRGFAAAAQDEVFKRGLELIAMEGVDRVMALELLIRLTTHTSAQSRVVESNRWADETLAMVDELGLPMLNLFATQPASTARLLNGRYEQARDLALLGLESRPVVGSDGPTAHPATIYGSVMLLCILGHAHAQLGETDLAVARFDEAVADRRSADPPDPHFLGWALYFRAMHRLIDNEYDGCFRDAEEMMAIGDRYLFSELSVAGRMFVACTQMLADDLDEVVVGVSSFEEQLARLPDFKPFAHLGLVHARGLARAGRIDDAIADAIALRDALHARAEFLCSEEFDALIGELEFDVAGDLEAARSCFERGLEAARQRKGRGPALSIAIRFAGVLRRAGNPGAAAEVLRDAMDGFPAPQATNRYAEALALLADLASDTTDSNVATQVAEGEERAH